MNYRPEIDGLRAIAVVPVIAFHAGFSGFAGGFVGVDVFFVISGYLITSLLLEDLERGRFSVADFYERRARRILPALFLVMALSIPFARIMLPSAQGTEFALIIVAVALFSSNFLFWRQSGYFDVAAEERPLLHTWSLAVEEQYYVLFPLFLWLAWRHGRWQLWALISAMAAVSFGLAEWGWRHYPTANFYLAPARFWELLAGSMAALLLMSGERTPSNVLSLLGFAFVLLSIVAFDETTPFPSAYTLLPVGGVVLLVLFAGPGTWVGKTLSSAPFVGIGRISYSAYLWHQPLFAFYRVGFPAAQDWRVYLALCVASMFLGYLSWRFVEAPFRDRSRFSRRQVLVLSLLGTLCFVVLGAVWNKVDFRTQSDLLLSDEVIETQRAERFSVRRRLCRQRGGRSQCDLPVAGKTNVLIVGDSHGIDALNILYFALQERAESVHLVLSAQMGCPPLRDIRAAVGRLHPNLEQCEALNRDRFNAAFLAAFDVVVVNTLFDWFREADLVAYLEFLEADFAGPVIVFGSTPRFIRPFPELVQRDPYSYDSVDVLAYDPRYTEATLRALGDKPRFSYLSKARVFCRLRCNWMTSNGDLITYDRHHLSVAASRQVAEFYREEINAVLLQVERVSR
ncbi:MAG: acyltransferase family protein [Pseudomonadota bacterium]